MEFLTIGKVINVRGLKGEVKLQSLTDFSHVRYRKGKTVYLEFNGTMQPLIVKSHHAVGALDFVQFNDYATVEAVTPWIGSYVYANKADITLEKGQYFFADLVGCMLHDHLSHAPVGVVKKVEEYNGKHLLRMTREGQADVLIPFVEPFIQHVDIEHKVIHVQFIDGML
jgi:16S rRNA processing protein RimM